MVLRQIITIGRCLAPVYQPCRAKASGQGTIKSHIIAALKKVPILPKNPALFSAFCFGIFLNVPSRYMAYMGAIIKLHTIYCGTLA
jgi:hypothetical protein